MMNARALLRLIQHSSDAQAAAAVTAFVGDINTRDDIGYSALWIAVYSGYVLTIAALAARGDCNLHAAPFDRFPPSHYATPCVVSTLLTCFPALHVDALCWSGQTALHVAVKIGYEAAVEFLLDYGADPTATVVAGRCRGWTPTSFAIEHRRHDCEKLLACAIAWRSSVRAAWMRACVVHE